MKIPFVDLKAQYESIKSEIDSAITEVISNSSFVGGRVVQEFEEAFASYIGVDYCVSCANGTDSMEIILKAMGIGSGDEVIVPANSWISTAEVVNNVGAEPVFVDVLPDEYTINPELIELAITSKTRAIIPVHLYGLPARMPEIMKLAARFGLKVIEDCAQAHGAEIAGKKVGAFGHAGSFSFYPGKNLGAYGDAGGIVTDDQELAIRCKQIGNHGQLKKHDHQVIGRNSRMDAIQAAVLNVKLTYLNEWSQKRIIAAHCYSDLLAEKICCPTTPKEYKHVFHLYVVRLGDRKRVMEAFTNAGIGYGIHYPRPLPFVSAYAYQGHEPSEYPVADALSKQILSLPIFPEISELQLKQVSEALIHSRGE
ncbi:DegT/DnrJ/EryC1/StrS family aminotransferase [Marinoscillum furvescens]|uniref:dTDP-4-amino-4,6-dideoxygalactose transaminase n=1 Tax=Marinoscillum furvescens DSM 4134 TaxID=1122208 RepID=A0A3D9L1C5_MARFU|nr:DegT/DnrJ/EryC1/StrS family aminotransferase [Marinoscillum furvescens]RED96630.1 dTDP-4-amino-4,6-dideoxygalactose transaminase [Marinoscillum furvescens DSM 4134]